MEQNQLFLLKGIADEKQKTITDKLNKTVKYSKGSVLYSENDFPDAIGFIVKGTASAVSGNGSGLFMRSFEPGDIFGSAAIFGKVERYISTIVAKTDMEVIFISENRLKELFMEFPETAINYIGFLSDRIRFLNKKLSLISSPSAEDTVYRYLSNISEGEYFSLPVSMTLLAKMLNIGRATLYRCFDNLEENGMIERKNNMIKVIENEKNY